CLCLLLPTDAAGIVLYLFSESSWRYLHLNEAKKTLAALARTCKTIHEPAMDELWANIDGLEPSLGCVTRLHPVIYPRTKKVSPESRV
ncbi:hypothetical protein DEU56DRAFT_836666, partial [Suillus clintonianus]|uniref:uncharacterized protein n=1 Tax=Suillus clintonianus TaxID=1904413 RepID=UPI001B869D50